MATSGLYNSLTPIAAKIVLDAYERAGVINPEITDMQVKSALTSINLILEEWINKGLNLWTVKQGMLALTSGQASYALPVGTSAILEATLRTSNRQLGGTAFTSAGGIAALAFDGNSNTACTQTVADGYISYNWGTRQYGISLVGIQSNVTRTYTLVGEYSFDNVTWINSITIPAQEYTQGQNTWFVVNVPTPANYFRIRETGGAILNVQELYFNTTIQDILITPFSRHEYVSQIQKQQTGRPTSYYIDRQINPTLYLWPCPSVQFNNLYYTYTRHMEDVAALTNNLQVPARFLRALVLALSHDLSLKAPQYDLARSGNLKSLADESYTIAATEDKERVPFRIYGEYMGWTQQ
jgi:hypothetical protein